MSNRDTIIEAGASAIQAGRYGGKQFPAANYRDFQDAERTLDAMLPLIKGALAREVNERYDALYDAVMDALDPEDLAFQEGKRDGLLTAARLIEGWELT